MIKFSTFARVFLLSGIYLLAGCVAGPNYVPPTSVALSADGPYVAPLPETESMNTSIISWWKGFNDPELSALVESAVVDNLDISVAASRLIQAREGLLQAGASRLPQLGSSASAGRNGNLFDRSTTFVPNLNGSGTTFTTSDYTNLSLSGDASYTVDLFGLIARSIEAASAYADAAALDVAAIRVTVAANTANAYIQGRIGQDRLAIARDSLVNAENNLEIAGWRVQAGLVSATDVEQARAQRAQRRAVIPQLEANIANAASTIALLTGQAPTATSNLFVETRRIPQPPKSFAVGVPADTLRQRPDVAAAERRLAAASAEIGVAQAQLYPALKLSGNISTNAPSFGALVDQLSFGLLSNLSQTIFDGGRLRSQLRWQRAAAEAALSSYRGAVLGALQDVEVALQALRSSESRRTAQGNAVNAAQASAIYARSQYQSGLIDFTSLLTIENQLLAARDGLALANGDRALAAVQLYTALGGGFGPASIETNNTNASNPSEIQTP